jgi:hypothetical protein
MVLDFLRRNTLVVAISAATLLVGWPASGAKAQTFTGTVSDAMCGAQHMMAGDPVACLRACVEKGSKYALVVGDKVYALDTTDKATIDTLYKLAGQKAKVTGQPNGDSIEVSSVTPVK